MIGGQLTLKLYLTLVLNVDYPLVVWKYYGYQHKRRHYSNILVSVGSRKRVQPPSRPVHDMQLADARSLSLTLTRVGELYCTNLNDQRMKIFTLTRGRISVYQKFQKKAESNR